MTADDVRSVRAGGALVNSHRPTTSRDTAPSPGYRHYRGLGRDATVDLCQPRGSLVLQIVRWWAVVSVRRTIRRCWGVQSGSEGAAEHTGHVS